MLSETFTFIVLCLFGLVRENGVLNNKSNADLCPV